MLRLTIFQLLSDPSPTVVSEMREPSGLKSIIKSLIDFILFVELVLPVIKIVP